MTIDVTARSGPTCRLASQIWHPASQGYVISVVFSLTSLRLESIFAKKKKSAGYNVVAVRSSGQGICHNISFALKVFNIHIIVCQVFRPSCLSI